ncbi:hypothetical protein DEI97_014525 [Curtobacterium sp. MCLR17_032]|uniref:hypothetical protein n=1 Tax=Curtobacterium sp. MCLR17_032 TaxID=2175650 RepID=UPI000DA7D072|nr:hypothetical protein [Curtobacterium sp. MCLR17_032]WIE60953.1 hypothetical protein DEI97_014525 [Curtobacterium sp. MCLR17_032]
MHIINSDTETVPFGKYEGWSFGELVDTDPSYALWLLRESELRSKYPDHYYDLEFYCLGLAAARRGWRRLARGD